MIPIVAAKKTKINKFVSFSFLDDSGLIVSFWHNIDYVKNASMHTIFKINRVHRILSPYYDSINYNAIICRFSANYTALNITNITDYQK